MNLLCFTSGSSRNPPGMFFSRSTQYLLVDVESDNQPLIKLCVSEDVPPWECMAVVLDIQSFSKLRRRKFGWTSRANNRAAHWLAMLGKSFQLTGWITHR
ncbi:hypothetical protein ACSBR2_000767 [Camellia fascicularis]